MLRKLHKIVLASFIILLIISCSDDNFQNISIDSDFNAYVDAFIESGAQRGKEIDFTDTGLTIQYGEVSEDAAAECSELGSGFEGSHKIKISKVYWNQIDELEREVIIFHELGHCELGRIHDNQIFSIGDWKSLMRGSVSQKDPAVHFYGTRREYYIDELFNPSIPFPAWIGIQPEFNVVTLDKSIEYEFDDKSEVGYSAMTKLDKFQIDIKIKSLPENGVVYINFGASSQEDNYSININAGLKNSMTFKKENVGTLNVLKPDLIIHDDAENNIRIRKDELRIDVFLNGNFIYWLDGSDVNLDLLEISSSSATEIPRFSGFIYSIRN